MRHPLPRRSRASDQAEGDAARPPSPCSSSTTIPPCARASSSCSTRSPATGCSAPSRARRSSRIALRRDRPDVVVLDYALARGDGLSACFRLKQRARPARRRAVLRLRGRRLRGAGDARAGRRDRLQERARRGAADGDRRRRRRRVAGARRPTRKPSRRPRRDCDAEDLPIVGMLFARVRGRRHRGDARASSRGRCGRARCASSARCRHRTAGTVTRRSDARERYAVRRHGDSSMRRGRHSVGRRGSGHGRPRACPRRNAGARAARAPPGERALIVRVAPLGRGFSEEPHGRRRARRTSSRWANVTGSLGTASGLPARSRSSAGGSVEPAAAAGTWPRGMNASGNMLRSSLAAAARTMGPRPHKRSVGWPSCAAVTAWPGRVGRHARRRRRPRSPIARRARNRCRGPAGWGVAGGRPWRRRRGQSSTRPRRMA